MAINRARFRMVVYPTALGNPEDLLSVGMELHPARDELVFRARDEGPDERGRGDVGDEVERERVAFAAHKEVLDEVCHVERKE
jgi:hypothetical protein